MKAYVTLDYFDGSKSKMKEMYLDGVSLQSLIFQMMEKNVCGFTVTKAENIIESVRKMNHES